MMFHAGTRGLTLRVGALFLAGSLGLVACGDADDESGAAGEDAPTVVATTGIWRDVVSNLACDGLAEVSALIPAGSDPHAFEPSLRDREALDEASLVVVNGLDLEEGLIDTIDAVLDDGVPVFAISDHISPAPLEGGDDHDDEESTDHAGEDEDGEEEHGTEEAADAGPDHEGGDPHIWFDPLRVSSALPALAGMLVDEAGLEEAAVRRCLEDYRAELERVDDDVTETLASVPAAGRKLVTNHGALTYLADRYGYEIIGTVIPSTSSLAQTNPAQLQDLVETVRSNGVKAIFAETQAATDDAEALGREAGGVEVVSLFTGSLGEDGSGAETYAGFMRTNATRIAEGLGAGT